MFLDHYLWELNSTFIFTSTTSLSEEDALTVGGQTTSFEYLITEQGYMSTPVLHYSIYVEMAGNSSALLGLFKTSNFIDRCSNSSRRLVLL